MVAIIVLTSPPIAHRTDGHQVISKKRIGSGLSGSEHANASWKGQGFDKTLKRRRPSPSSQPDPDAGKARRPVFGHRYIGRKEASGTWSIIDSFTGAICKIGGRQVTRLCESDATEMAMVLNEYPLEVPLH
ncbi:hypothetical protein ACO34A_28540 (plasmid) [Rhizobium sp. ACO-34A]|nr:hypothetical protein [Rhizobium sp. ACO-34A]ATN37716.1 hypothetical protein ACO34A_28540 [Rhizobium sp. ACO-34A]